MQLIPRFLFNAKCAEAIEFYKEGLGATVDYVTTYGDVHAGRQAQSDLIMNAQLDIGGVKFHLADVISEDISAGNHLALTLIMPTAEDVQAAFAKLKQDGMVIMQPQETFFSPCHCALKDRYNIVWQFNCQSK